jgi:glycosyltransferase involved in cell wall biosynthesis
MRILQVLNSLDPADGGPPAVVLRLSAALATEGAEVTIYSTERAGRESDIERTLQGIPGIEKVHRHSEICDSRFDCLFGEAARAFLRREGKQFDLVYVHGLWRPPLQAILRESIHQNLPFVVTPHGMLARWALAQKPLRKRVALALLWRRLIGRSLFVHALTPAEANDFRALGIEAPVEVIPNGCFLEEMGELPPPGTFRARHPEVGGQPYILFLARLHYVKRADLLVRAFAKVAARVPDVKLVVAGPDFGTRALIEETVVRQGLKERVFLPGPLYGKEKYAAMADAICFCQSSVYETFSMSILEAMACGLPVVVTKGCNFDEIKDSGAGLVVDDDDGGENALADALGTICTNEAFRAQAARRARELVVEKYTWPIVARRLLTLLEDKHVARGGRGRR